jgi:nucleoside-diphosphate-sugar epimerase
LSENVPVIIFGPGYTASRLALRLISRNTPVFALAREPAKHARLQAAGVAVMPLVQPKLPENARIVYSIPPLSVSERQPIRHLIGQLAPRRLIYISATSIYGNLTKVDENSPINVETNRARERADEETHFSSCRWPTLILRPAAIYGPWRGVHTRVRAGLLSRGASSLVTSRIHVDDLVRLIEAGLERCTSDGRYLEGAWPVADEEPCSAAEIAGWCARHFKVPLNTASAPENQEPGRSVDGSAIFRALRVQIFRPSWRTGIPACLAEEAQSSGCDRRSGQQVGMGAPQ